MWPLFIVCCENVIAYDSKKCQLRLSKASNLRQYIIHPLRSKHDGQSYYRMTVIMIKWDIYLMSIFGLLIITLTHKQDGIMLCMFTDQFLSCTEKLMTLKDKLHVHSNSQKTYWTETNQEIITIYNDHWCFSSTKLYGVLVLWNNQGLRTAFLYYTSCVIEYTIHDM